MLRYFLLILILSSVVYSSAQDFNNLSASDLNSVNIDELSDEQVQQFLNQAQESGLTLDQLELIAKQRGMSSVQLAKLRNRIRQLQYGGGVEEQGIISPSNRLRDANQNEEDEFGFFSFLAPTDSSTTDKLEVFGMDIFRRSDISFEPSQNVATPEKYILGAGDEVIIDVYGASEITYQEFISPDGKMLISGVGPVSLSGLNVKQARVRLFNKLSSIYSGLKGNNPNTFIDVSVGQVKSIRVNVVGAVVQPGTYILSSFSTAFNALYYAGGPTESGSLREIEVVRNGEKVATLDVYDYLFLGKESQNPQLLDEDVVLVKPYLNRVKIAGNVKNPAIFELKNGETVDFLLNISGGFSEKAFKESLTIDRAGERERGIRTIRNDSFADEQILNGDSIFIGSILNSYSNRVKIQGAVNRPGSYELTPELMLLELIDLAGGLREDAYFKRGNIVRVSADFALKNIAFDVKEVVEGRQNILLSPEDIVLVNSIFDLEEEKIISIQGQVNRPGDYPYIEGMTAEDLINLAGGLKEDANPKKIEVAKRSYDEGDIVQSSKIHTFEINKDLAVNDQASTLQLDPFDLVLIRSTPYVHKHKVIRIEGEINSPGFYALETNEDKISDLIVRAGGLTRFGYPEGASLIRRTEYYRTELEKEELEALLELEKRELEKKFLTGNTTGFENYDFVESQLVEYEKELTEAFKIEENSDQLESRIFRAQQLRKLLVRDSISGAEELIERQAIGIELSKILNNPNSKFDLILEDGDLISIPKKLETVRVQGEVLYPNTVRYNDGMTLKQYVSNSGGFSTRAKIGKSYIVYANGSAKRTRSFLFFKDFPSVKPGADIIVPRKRDRRKLSSGEVLGITSGLASLSLVILQIINLTN